jgi:hypothetical protein
MHHHFMGDVAIGKDDFINRPCGNNRLQLLFRQDRDTVWIQGTCKFGRIDPSRDVGNLGRP